jgi:hypothetical protein
MHLLKSRTFLASIGALAMIVIGVSVAFWLLNRHPPSSEPPPASQTGLVIDVQQGAQIKRDPNQQYRCFKNGQYIGMATLEQCAKENGVVSGALDVGIDQTGALAAAQEFDASVAPLPPAPGQVPPAVLQPAPAAPVTAPPSAAAPAPAAPTVSRGPSAPCQRYERNWASLGEMPLNACLQVLYAGHCARPGQAIYGRWGDQTLRLVPGRVEQSRDDRVFRPLVEQGAGCTIPQL